MCGTSLIVSNSKSHRSDLVALADCMRTAFILFSWLPIVHLGVLCFLSFKRLYFYSNVLLATDEFGRFITIIYMFKMTWRDNESTSRFRRPQSVRSVTFNGMLGLLLP